MRSEKNRFSGLWYFSRYNFILLNSWIPYKRGSNESIPAVLTKSLWNELWKERIRNTYYRLRIFVIICFDFSVHLEIIYSRVPNNRLLPKIYSTLPSIFNFVMSKILSQNFDSISIKPYAKFLHKTKMLIKKFWIEEKDYVNL